MTEQKNTEQSPEEDNSENSIVNEESQTTNTNPQTKNMEVHHHPNVEKKNFKEYFLEFLMIFLAVTLGFFAESYREYLSDCSKEKEYIQSLVNDLSIDSARLHDIIDSRNQREALLDSLMKLIQLPNRTKHSGNIYYYNSFASRMTFRFNSDDGTLQQLKNAGNLRLISKQQVRDSIMSYDVGARTRAKNDDEEVAAMEAYRIVAQEIFDGSELEKIRDANNDVLRIDNNPPLRNNEDAIFKLIYRIHMLKNFNRTGRRENRLLLQKANNLIALLKKEYP
jgi:hypothetical protein